MKLEAGMYVRFSDGEIGKIAKYEFEKEFTNGHCFYLESNPTTGSCCEEGEFKVSHNVIDLIQEGDYVNGYPVYEIIEYEDNTRAIVIGDDNKSIIWEESSQYIKSIVTKEQFKSVEYEVKK